MFFACGVFFVGLSVFGACSVYFIHDMLATDYRKRRN